MKNRAMTPEKKILLFLQTGIKYAALSTAVLLLFALAFLLLYKVKCAMGIDLFKEFHLCDLLH